jgi:ribosomal peptide maturation radical SAM protein 1
MLAILTPSQLELVQGSASRASLIAGPRGDVSSLDEGELSRRAAFHVGLVTMPFQSAQSPSIQIGLLRAIGESHGFPVSTYHLCLEFARRVEFSIYEELCQMRGRMIGDWLFSVEAFRHESPDREARFLDDFAADVTAQFGKPGKAASSVVALRHRLAMLRIRNEVVPAFLRSTMAEIDWSQFRVVGFSSVFQQTVASIALARRIKEAFPQVQTVFGGSNFEDEMGLELIRSSPWIDYAVLGEGDEAFPELLVALSEDKPTEGIPGVASRGRDGRVKFGGPRKLLESLDQLPIPRYDEYFTRAEATGLLPPSRRRSTRIPFETARGCWWGAKHHCTFCGLNANGMQFRSKSPRVAENELAALARAHGTFTFNAVDNIVDLGYLKTLFPQIVAGAKDYRIFYELKSNLSREQIRGLREAGVTAIQPGIESLNTHVLGLMRKGVSAIQNVNTLRWATYYRMYVGWNLLWGFPGERRQDYTDQARLVRHLLHLVPPSMSGVRILMERFSPLFFDRDSFPVEFARAEVSYSYVYPSSVDLEKVAYFFEYKLRDALPDDAYADLRAGLQAWIDAWSTSTAGTDDDAWDASTETAPSRPSLTFFYSDDFLRITDGRSNKGSSVFEGVHARLYKAASDRPVTARGASESAGAGLSPPEVERVMEGFCEQGYMMRDEEKFLSLALPATPGR